MKKHLAYLTAIILFSLTLTVSGQVPLHINYQGRLLDNTNLASGPYELVFELYTTNTGGTAVYYETQTVTIVDGLYSARMGDDVAGGLFASVLTNQSLWLQVNVEGTPLNPREQIGAVSYAIMAAGVTNRAISTPMLADGAVIGTKIALDSVGATHIKSGAIHSNHISSGSIESRHLLPACVQSPHIANGAVASNNIQPGAISARELQKRYTSGAMDYAILATTGTMDFAAFTTNTQVLFGNAFDATPIVTLSLQSPSEDVMTSPPYILDAGLAAFTARISVPASLPHNVDTNSDPSIYQVKMAIVDGHPAVVYFDTTEDDLVYCRAEDSYGVSWGTPLRLATNGATGLYPSLAIVNGNPAISFYNSDDDDLLYIRALDTTGDTWDTPIPVDTNGNVGMSSCLDIINGNPGILYQESASDKNILFVRSLDVDGTSWGTPVTVATNIGSYDLSLAVVSTLPATVFQDDANTLNYLRADDVNGASWTASPIIVDTNGLSGQYSSLAVVAGNPAIAFRIYDSGAFLRYIRASDVTGSTWPTSSSTIMTNTGSYTWLAVINDTPCITSFEEISKSIVFIHANDSYGNSWDEAITLDTGLLNYSGNCLLEVESAPAISYGNRDYDLVRYIRSGNPTDDTYLNWIAIEP